MLAYLVSGQQDATVLLGTKGGNAMAADGLLASLNDRVKDFGVLDIKLAQGAAIFVALVVVKLIPEIMTISIWWFVALMIICAIRPVWLFLKTG